MKMLWKHGGWPRAEKNASRCLATSRPCQPAPFLPSGTNLTMVSANASIQRTLFGVPTYRIPTYGDGIVLDPSMSGYLDSGPSGATRGPGRVGFATPTCVDDSGRLSKALRRANPPVEIASAWARLLTDGSTWEAMERGAITPGSATTWLSVFLGSACSHGEIMGHQQTRTSIVDAAERAFKKIPVPSMTDTQILNASIPAGSCYDSHQGQGWRSGPDPPD